jgi:hypothetical protein
MTLIPHSRHSLPIQSSLNLPTFAEYAPISHTASQYSHICSNCLLAINTIAENFLPDKGLSKLLLITGPTLLPYSTQIPIPVNKSHNTGTFTQCPVQFPPHAKSDTSNHSRLAPYHRLFAFFAFRCDILDDRRRRTRPELLWQYEEVEITGSESLRWLDWREGLATACHDV